MIKIPHYHIEEHIYESRYSLIYRAIDENTQQKVVIKILKGEYPSASRLARFEHEFKITKFLHEKLDDRIIRPLELIKYENTYALILEDFGGISLAKVIHDKSLNLEQSLRLAIEIAKTIALIHSQQVLIKDINPSNILWNPVSNQLKIIDFGISTTLSYENLEMTSVNVIEGTLTYISPEQTGRMNRNVDYRSDYYSLGATLYEMITGTIPFKSQDAMELVHAHIAKKPIPPHEIVDDIPPLLSRIILKLLSKTPEERYQSMQGLIFDLEECLNQIKNKKFFVDFELATQDISTIFRIPEKLYGRQTEVKLLLQAFNKANLGEVQLFLISGTPGVGKSALVHEVQKPIAAQKGFFISGKFDQNKRDIPYESLSQALQKLFQEILMQDAEKILSWRKIFQKALGVNGKLIISLIPQIKQIIGPQPDLIEVGMNEAQNRFNYVLQNLILSLASEEHPLTIFLDDLQWADLATIELIEQLLTNPQSHHLFLIGSYRNNDRAETQKIHHLIEKLKVKNINLNQIELNPLKTEDIEDLLRDTLHRDSLALPELASLCYLKTRGNPFFLNQLLLALYQERLIYFDLNHSKWKWDIQKIRKKDISENVVEFMSFRILELHKETQEILKIAACLGNRFSLKVLATIYKKTIVETSDELWPALEEGLVLPESNKYKFIDNAMGEDVYYKFLHDRVQQAIYSLISEEKRKSLHYLIGKILLSSIPQEEVEEQVFEIVNHLNLALDLIDEKEKIEISRLNFLAGQKARNSSAFQTAVNYFKIGNSILPKEAWQNFYDIKYPLIKLYSECLYIVGEHEQAEIYIQEALKHSKTNLDKGEIYVMQEILFTLAGKKQEVVLATREALKTLEITFPKKSSNLQVLKEYLKIKWNLGFRKISSLSKMPELKQPHLKLALRVLQECESVAYYIGDINLHALLVFKQMNITLKYGNTQESARVYNAYAVMQNIIGNLKKAQEFGDLCLKLLGNFTNTQTRIRTLGIYTIMVHGWSHHWKTLKKYFEECIEVGIFTGDFGTAAIGATYILNLDPLISWQKIVEENQHYLDIVKLSKFQDLWDSAKLQYRLRENLCGHASDILSLSDKEFDEEECLTRLKQSQFNPGIAVYYLCKSTLYYHLGYYSEALKMLEEGEKYKDALLGTLLQVLNVTYAFIIRSRFYSLASSKEKGNLINHLRQGHRTVQKWAKHCPINFSHLLFLMEAELEKIQKNRQQASLLYEKALNAAKTNEYPLFEAIINELTANFYEEIDKEKIAKFYFQEACYQYQKIGAKSIVENLEKKKPSWNIVHNYSPLNTVTVTLNQSRHNMTTRVLDFISIMKTTQVLTREMDLPKLIEKMMLILLENATAEKGILFLEENGVMTPKALAEVDAVTSIHSKNFEDFPKTIIQKVIEIKTTVLIKNAVYDELSREDPYIKSNHNKSILCIPLLNLGDLRGLLYLENNSSIDAFKQEHTDILNMLSTQMAITLDNASFYKQLELKVEERTHALKDTQQQLIQKEKMAFLGMLTTGIAHEIKNPLNFIINFSQLTTEAAKELDDHLKRKMPEQYAEIQPQLNFLKDNTEHIYEQGQKANIIVNRMIEHSSQQSRQFVLTDIVNLIENSFKLSQSLLQKKYPDFQVALKKDFDPNVQYIKISNSDINQVMINLIDNAYDALFAKKLTDDKFEPIINIKTIHLSRGVEIHIKDNGIGIDAENQKRIFTPFFTTKPSGKGIGLGLSLCYNIIVSEHGGTLTYETKKGEFTEFILTIPHTPHLEEN